MARRNATMAGSNVRSSDIGVQPNESAGRDFLTQHHWPTGSEILIITLPELIVRVILLKWNKCELLR